MILSRKVKDALVIKLAKEGKTTRHIAKVVHISLRDIGKILRKDTGDDEHPTQQEIEKQVENEKKKRWR